MADAENPACVVAQPLLRRGRALVDDDLAVLTIAIAVAQNVVQHLSDNVAAVGRPIAVAVTRVILR